MGEASGGRERMGGVVVRVKETARPRAWKSVDVNGCRRGKERAMGKAGRERCRLDGRPWTWTSVDVDGQGRARTSRKHGLLARIKTSNGRGQLVGLVSMVEVAGGRAPPWT